MPAAAEVARPHGVAPPAAHGAAVDAIVRAAARAVARIDAPDAAARDRVFRRLARLALDEGAIDDDATSASGSEPAAVAAIRRTPTALGDAYERLLHAGDRRARGAFYTPPAIVDGILDLALEPLLDRVVADAAPGGPEGVERALLALRLCDPAAGTGRFLVPAAQRVARRLAALRAGPGASAGAPVDPAAHRAAVRDVTRRCLRGADRDATALAIARATLALAAGDAALVATLESHLLEGDALLGASPAALARGMPDAALRRRSSADPEALRAARRRHRAARRAAPGAERRAAAHDALPADRRRALADAWCAGLLAAPDAAPPITEAELAALERDDATLPAATRDAVAAIVAAHRPLHWHLAFPDVHARGGFDAVVGNPPFLNQLESATAASRGAAAVLAARFGGAVRGYADLSAAFLLLATELLRPGGRTALVQPQALLAAAHAGAVRRAVLDRASLVALWVAGTRVFPGASVLTCAPVLEAGGPRHLVLRRAHGPAFAPRPSIDLDQDALAAAPTWAPLALDERAIPRTARLGAGTLAAHARATADFRDQYYGLAGCLVEDADLAPADRCSDAFPPLLTTGLVDLAACRWGIRPTRVLKRAWRAPRVDARRLERTTELGPWLAARRGPKIVLATQTRVLEVLVDAEGVYVPSLPLVTVTPHDPARIWHVAAALAAPPLAAEALARHAGAALDADAIKLAARDVLALPAPVAEADWDRAADALRAAHRAPTAAERDAALDAYGAAACAAYGLDAAAIERTLAWWRARRAPRRRGNTRQPAEGP